tara:strand:- start:26867 stop:27718 length:852 start_codon:yes stop_codon:yes gene_type:complete
MSRKLSLEVNLQKPEINLATIRPGTEQMIRWKDTKKQDEREYAFVYIHGFTGHRGEISPLIEDIQDQFDANLFFARLAGHGIEGKTIRAATITDWFTNIDQTYAFAKRLGKKRVYVGASTGAGMAMLLTEKYDPQSCLVLLSPNFGLSSELTMLGTGPLGYVITSLFVGNSASDYVTLYPSEEESLVSTRIDGNSLNQFLELTKIFKQYNYENYENPVLMLYSKEDTVIDPGAVERVFRSLKKNPNNQIYNVGTGHLLFEKDDTTALQDTKQKIISFIQKNCQ